MVPSISSTCSSCWQRRALTNDTMPAAKVQEIRLEMERAEAQRLQPHHIQSFFVEAFKHLGGQIKRREEGRWEITHVPVSIRERDRQIGTGAPVQKKYERICFEKSKINQQPVAAFVCPGHPLLEAVISIVREQYDHLMKHGAVLVDDTDPGEDIAAIFLLEHSVQDGRPTSTGKPHIVSEKLQFAAIDQTGNADQCRHRTPPEPAPGDARRNRAGRGQAARGLAAHTISKRRPSASPPSNWPRSHVAEVKARRLPEIDKVEQEVKARLKKEINYWDDRAVELNEDEKAGKKTRLNWQNAERRAEDLAERLKRRMELLEKERFISAQPPRVRGGMVVIPQGLLIARAPSQDGGKRQRALPRIRRPGARARLKAMEAVMTVERALGNEPTDVSAQKVGYDIASYDPRIRTSALHRGQGPHRRRRHRDDHPAGDHHLAARAREIHPGHRPDREWLRPRAAVCPRGAVDHEPSFEHTAIQFNLKRLLERAEVPK